MKQSEMIWMCLPQGLDELFEIVRFERTDQAYNIWLDEKKERAEEDRRNPNIVLIVFCIKSVCGYLSKCHCYPMKIELVPHIFGISIACNIF